MTPRPSYILLCLSAVLQSGCSRECLREISVPVEIVINAKEAGRADLTSIPSSLEILCTAGDSGVFADTTAHFSSDEYECWQVIADTDVSGGIIETGHYWPSSDDYRDIGGYHFYASNIPLSVETGEVYTDYLSNHTDAVCAVNYSPSYNETTELKLEHIFTKLGDVKVTPAVSGYNVSGLSVKLKNVKTGGVYHLAGEFWTDESVVGQWEIAARSASFSKSSPYTSTTYKGQYLIPGTYTVTAAYKVTRGNYTYTVAAGSPRSGTVTLPAGTACAINITLPVEETGNIRLFVSVESWNTDDYNAYPGEWEIPDGSESLLFSVREEGLAAEVRSDVTEATLCSDGFEVWAYHNSAQIFGGYAATYSSTSGNYSVSGYWPHASLGYGYSFVAAGRNLPNPLYAAGDIDGDNGLDYCFDVYSAAMETSSDAVVARNGGSYTSGVVPLTFRHVYARIGGLSVKAQNVSGAQVRVKRVELSVPESATMNLLSRDGIRWSVRPVIGGDVVLDGAAPVDPEDPEDPGLDPIDTTAVAAGGFSDYFPFRNLFSGSVSAGTSSEESLGPVSLYVIPTDCLIGDGDLFVSPAVPMKMRVTYDVYVSGILTEENKEREHRVTLRRGDNYIFHLILPVQEASGLSVRTEIVPWQTGPSYAETL